MCPRNIFIIFKNTHIIILILTLDVAVDVMDVAVDVVERVYHPPFLPFVTF